MSAVAKIGYIPQFKASNARDQDEVSNDLARMESTINRAGDRNVLNKLTGFHFCLNYPDAYSQLHASCRAKNH